MRNRDTNFRSVFINGLRWSALKRFGQAFLSITVIIIMARLLNPSDFGLVAMATVFTGISNVFTELGTGDALIRKKNPTNDFISSIFWLNTSLAFLVCLVLAAIASSVADLYGQDIIEILIYVLSIEILLSGINRVSHALLEKNMRFKAIAFAQITSQICGASIGITMAFLGYGLWSLVFLGISSQLIYTIIVNLALRWRPSVTFNFNHIKSIFSFSSYLTLVKILDHIQRRSEIFIVAYLMGSHLGGVYSQSHSLLRKPVKLISGFMAPVLFSTMSSLLENIERVKSLYLKSIQSFAMIYIPISVVLILYSEPFVLFILGEKWFEMAEIMPVFGFMLLFASMHKCNTIALKSVGRVDLLFRMYVVFVIASIVGCIIGAQFGIFWVAVSMLITTFLLFIASTIISTQVLKIKFVIYFEQISTLITYGLLMFISGYLLNLLLSSFFESSHILLGIFGFLICSIVYILALLMRPVPAWHHFKELLNIRKL